jgi:heat shock protein HtpX
MIGGVTGVAAAAPSPYEVAAGHASGQRRRALGLVAGATAPAAVVVLVVVVLAVGVVVAVPVAVVLWAGLTGWLWRAAPGLVVRGLGAEPADPDRHARLHNLAESLCVAAGLPKPALLVVADDAPNSLSVGLSRQSACLVVTSGLADKLSRLELEAVLAHELSHIRRGDIAVSAAAGATLGPVLRVAPGAGRRLADRVLEGREAAADVAAVGLTRYPPALVSALERMRDEATGAPGRGPSGTALLWNVAPVPPGTADTVDVRIEALLEL